jgi:hypothetical protein
MPTTTLKDLIPVLQVAVGPVIFISGVGLVLLSLTNRFARAVDRSRELVREMREAGDADRPRLAGQVQVLYRRARLIQISVVLSTISVLLAAVMMITLFITAVLNLEAAVLIIVLFVLCLVSLIASLVTFILEINLSLRALKLELGR